MANEDKIPMIGVDDKMSTLEEVIQFGDGVHYREALEFLDLPANLHIRKRFGHKLDGAKLGVNYLEEDGTDTRGGGVSVEIDGVVIV